MGKGVKWRLTDLGTQTVNKLMRSSTQDALVEKIKTKTGGTCDRGLFGKWVPPKRQGVSRNQMLKILYGLDLITQAERDDIKDDEDMGSERYSSHGYWERCPFSSGEGEVGIGLIGQRVAVGGTVISPPHDQHSQSNTGLTENYAVTLLSEHSKIGLDMECLRTLWGLVETLSNFEVITTCCRQTQPKLLQERQNEYDYLQVTTCPPAEKWLLILNWWLRTWPYDPNGQLSILTFVANLCDELEPSRFQDQLRGWLSETAPLLDEGWMQRSKPLSVERPDAISQVRGYCVVDIDVSTINPDALLYQCKLHIQVGQDNECQEDEWKPLINRSSEALNQCSLPTLPDDIEKVCADVRMDVVRQQLPFWIKQAEELLLDKCKALKQRYGLEALGCYETLTLEFCLPWDLLIECVDVWQIHSTERRRIRNTIIGQQYRVVVRCRDRFLDPNTINELNKRWQPFQALVADGQEIAEADWEKYVKVIDSREVAGLSQKNEFELTNYFCQYLGLGLTFPFCSSKQIVSVCSDEQACKEVRDNLVNGVLDAGVPLIIWSRDHTLRNLDTNLKELLAQRWFKDFNMLIQQVLEKRRMVDDPLGKELGVWCDDPERIAILHEMFYEQRGLGA